MSKLALVIIARNEEACIARCLNSAAVYVDEMIVVDTGSTDHTKNIAADCGARVFDYEWNHDFSAARNFALSCSSSDWNLILDADECISEISIDVVKHFMGQRHAVGRIQIVSETFVDGERNEMRNYISRFIPRGIRFKGRIHEQVDTTMPRVNLPIIVKHDGYLDNNKSDRNIPLLLEESRDHPTDPYYYYQLAKEYRGIDKFETSNIYFDKAYRLLCGKERYAPNVVVDYIYLLIKTKQLARVMDIIETGHQWLIDFPDYHFVCGLFYLDLAISDTHQYISYLPQIEASYKRCLEIGESDQFDSVTGTGSFAAWYNLGNYYEVLGRIEEAIKCYRNSADMGYKKAEQRLLETI